MASTFVNAGTEASAGNGGITLNAPASPQNGDIWIAAIHSTDNVSHTLSDWTQIAQGNGGGATSHLSVWYFRYAGSTPNLIVGHTAGDTIIGGIAAFRGCITTGSPVDVSNGIKTGTGTETADTLTPTNDGSCVVAIAGRGDDDSLSVPTNFTARWEDSGAGTQNAYVSTTGTDGGIGCFTWDQTTKTATGALTFTSAATDPWATLIFSLKPAVLALTAGIVTDADTISVPGVVLRAPSSGLGSFYRTHGSPVGGVINYAGADQPLTATLYEDADTFYAPRAGVGLVPTLYADADTFYAPTVQPGAISLTATVYSDPDTFYAPTIGRGAISLTASLYEDADTVYVPVGGVGIVPALVEDADTFYAPAVELGAISLTAALLVDADAFYAPTVAYTVTASLYQDADTFYAPSVAAFSSLTASLYEDTDEISPPTVTYVNVLTAAIYADPDAFFGVVVEAPGALQSLIVGSAYLDADTFYAPTVGRGTVGLTASLHIDPDVISVPIVGRGAIDLKPGTYENANLIFRVHLHFTGEFHETGGKRKPKYPGQRREEDTVARYFEQRQLAEERDARDLAAIMAFQREQVKTVIAQIFGGQS